LVPFVAAWYPRAYAHHHLPTETVRLPSELGPVPASLLLSEAREVIEAWCGLTGELGEDGVRRLADAYLRRWGVQPSDRPIPDAHEDTEQAVPNRERKPRNAKPAPVQRSRATRAAAAVETG
jgi:hypothetical protein